MKKLNDFILKHFTYPLHSKTIYWSKYVRIFCDGGQPIFRYYPVFRKTGYDDYWKMRGITIYWLGREFNFSFGKDVNNLYAKFK